MDQRYNKLLFRNTSGADPGFSNRGGAKDYVDTTHIPSLWKLYIQKNKNGSNLTRKGSTGAKLHSGSTMTRKSVNLTWNMTQSWVTLTPLFVKYAESWPISGSSLTRNGVWPQWTLSGSSLTRVFLECSFRCDFMGSLSLIFKHYDMYWIKITYSIKI